MPWLLIHIANNRWVASVANTNVQYNFAGATLVQQQNSMEALAVSMNNAGPQVLTQNIRNIFTMPEGVDEVQVVNQLFSTTDVLMFGENMIWGDLNGGAVLINSLADAAQALLEAILAL
jgi:hypothetical protein